MKVDRALVPSLSRWSLLSRISSVRLERFWEVTSLMYSSISAARVIDEERSSALMSNSAAKRFASERVLNVFENRCLFPSA